MYRILTEDKNRELVYSILDKWLKGYPVTEATGAWKGQRERSLVIDVVNETASKIKWVAECIKYENGQESVLILDLPVTATFV